MVSRIIVVYRLRIQHLAGPSLTAVEDEGEFPNIAQVETPVQTPAGPSHLTVSDLPKSDNIDIFSPL
jgi:hypothetical protein